MMDALMYGITPSAKMVIWDRLLPENMSYRPNNPFWACLVISANAAPLIPGVGTCEPAR